MILQLNPFLKQRNGGGRASVPLCTFLVSVALNRRSVYKALDLVREVAGHPPTGSSCRFHLWT